MTRNKIILICFFIISVLGIAQGKNRQKILTKYIKEITSTNHHRSLVLIYNNASNVEKFANNLYHLHLPLYNIYLKNLEKFNGEYGLKYDIAVTYEESKIYFLFIYKLSNLYDDLMVIRKIYFWRDRDRIVVFINKNSSFPDIEAAFQFCYKFYIVNIVFAFLNDKIEAFSYNPFSKDYSLLVEDPKNLFPDKFQNLYGYRLRISMFPSVINTLHEGQYHGADGHMSRTIATHLNATYINIHPRITKLAPVLNQFDDVAERVTDVGFNTRYIKFNFKNLIEKTYPHDRDDLTCLIPKRQMKKFTGIKSLLTKNVWMLSAGVSIFFFLYINASRILEKKNLDRINVIMMILTMLTNKPVKENQRINFRIALISYLIFSFFLNTLILCRVASIFTAPARFHGIETLQELAETNYKILTIDRFQELLDASLQHKLKANIMSRLIIIQEEEFLDKMKECRKVVFICKDHLANYAQIQPENYPNGVQFYRIMKERILPTLSCYIVSYGSPFLHRFDVLVRRLLEAGIYDYWKLKTWERLGINNHIRYNKYFYAKALPVSAGDISIALKILIFGLLTSLITFLLEIVSIKYFKT